jgi:neurofibromin 1
MILAKSNKQALNSPTSKIQQQPPLFRNSELTDINYLSSSKSSMNTNLLSTNFTLSPSSSTILNISKTPIRKSATNSTQQNFQQPSTTTTTTTTTKTTTVQSTAVPDLTSRPSITNDLNILLDPEIINDYPTQALLLTVLATLVRNSSDENEVRILYEYIAEASIVFAKVFPVIHNLLDSKINNILQLSLDESILNSVQSIIQNMISSCELDSIQQQLSYLQSCGFGGLWRFAQPFSTLKEKPENVELFVDCLEAMVETCLPGDYESFSCDSSNNLSNAAGTSQINNLSTSNINQLLNGFANATSTLITGSMSSISMGSINSPSDKDSFEMNDLNNLNKNTTTRHRRNSSPKNITQY